MLCYTHFMPKIFKIIDLFSGCGGSAKGFQQAGFDIRVAVDINKKAGQSFKLNFPNAQVFDNDIQNITGSELIKAAGAKSGDEIVIIACPPCQGFSTARRKAQRMNEPRNNLIEDFTRIVKEIKPAAFVMENVPGLVTGIGKQLFLKEKEKLEELGYVLSEPKIVNAADYGVPQRRKRLVLIGIKDRKKSLSFPAVTNRSPDEMNSDLPVWLTVKETILHLPFLKAGKKDPGDSLHAASNLADINLQRMSQTPHDGGGRDSWSEDLVLECHKKVNGYHDIYGRMKWDEPSPTITAGCVMISKGRFGHPEQDRAISLREAALLQTFPEDYQFVGNTGDIASQIGNAVPPLLAKHIAEFLNEVLTTD